MEPEAFVSGALPVKFLKIRNVARNQMLPWLPLAWDLYPTLQSTRISEINRPFRFQVSLIFWRSPFAKHKNQNILNSFSVLRTVEAFTYLALHVIGEYNM